MKEKKKMNNNEIREELNNIRKMILIDKEYKKSSKRLDNLYENYKDIMNDDNFNYMIILINKISYNIL